jgi:hypothetical protein
LPSHRRDSCQTDRPTTSLPFLVRPFCCRSQRRCCFAGLATDGRPDADSGRISRRCPSRSPTLYSPRPRVPSVPANPLHLVPAAVRLRLIVRNLSSSGAALSTSSLSGSSPADAAVQQLGSRSRRLIDLLSLAGRARLTGLGVRPPGLERQNGLRRRRADWATDGDGGRAAGLTDGRRRDEADRPHQPVSIFRMRRILIASAHTEAAGCCALSAAESLFIRPDDRSNKRRR